MIQPRRILAAVLLLVATTACQIQIEFDTIVTPDGSGLFRVAVTADKELRDLRQSEGGLAPVDDLFDQLSSMGWSVARSEPAGGLRVSAEKAFASPDEFGSVLDELRSARTAEDAGELGSVDLSMSVDRDPGLLQTGTSFTARLDTSALEELGPELLAELRRLATFQVTVDLPGSTRVDEGQADIDQETVVWRPQLGESAELKVSSVARDTGLFVGLLFAGISLVLFASAIVAARKRRRGKQEPNFTALQDVEIRKRAERE
ncbi:MAG: hypothetical protein ACLGH3_00265 [Actinomycetota bacterium]